MVLSERQHNLTLNSTLKDLPSSNFTVEINRLGKEIVENFSENPDLPGVILINNHQLIGIISRAKFFECLSRPYGADLYLNRPIGILWQELKKFIPLQEKNTFFDHLLYLPADYTIHQAVEIALKRPANLAYEPIIIDFGKQQLKLLSINILLVTYSQLFNLATLKLQEQESKLKHQNKILVSLAKNKDFNQKKYHQALQKITKTASLTLGIERVSIWLFDKEKTQLNCLYLGENRSKKHNLQLDIEKYPIYFQALKTEKSVIVHNVYTDERTQELTLYSQENKVFSLLDIPIRLRGKIVGVLCCEQTKIPRFWNLEEQNFVHSLADLISLTLEVRQRTLAEDALSRSYAQLKAQQEAAPDGILMFDEFDRLVSYNQKFLELWAIPLEIINLSTKDDILNYLQLHLENNEFFTGFFDFLEKNYPQIGQQEIILKTGTVLSCSCNQVTSSTGDCYGIVYYFKDVTIQKRKEEILRINEANYRNLVETSAFIIVCWTPEKSLKFINDYALEFFGYSKQKLAQKLINILPQIQLNSANYSSIIEQICENPKYRMINEGEHLCANGKKVWITWNSKPFINDQGELAEILSVGVDSTARKKAENALSQQNVQLQQEIEQRQRITKRLDFQNYILELIAKGSSLQKILLSLISFVEQEFTQVFGSILLINNEQFTVNLSPSLPDSYNEQINQLNLDLLPAITYENKSLILENFLELIKPLAHKVGLTHYLCKEIFSSQHKILGLFLIYFPHHYSSLLIDDQLIDKTIHLASVAIERHYTSTALQKAKETAESANLAKSQFLASMSHELRTPLNAILGFAQVMSRDLSLKPEHQEHLSIINRSGEHLLNLINDVLEMSKIEAGRTKFTQNDFDLFALLNNLENMFKLKAKSKNIELIFLTNNTVPHYVQTDESKLRQVLINIISNAIKFTNQGHVILRVKAIEIADHLNYTHQIHFEIEDTGPGIDPEDISLLFKPFVQTKIGTQSSQGTGLGLAISRQFTEMMGGEISIQSKVNQGSIFSFYIYTAPCLSIPTEMTNYQNKIMYLAPDQPEYRILVVEDNNENRQLLMKILLDVGFSVQEARNGKEAIALWNQWQPHLIWMDLKMPIMDGLQATKKIRHQEKKHQKKKQNQELKTIIIALTASAFEEQKSEVLALGCDDFVRKPFRTEVLLNKIKEYLDIEYIYEDLISHPPATPELDYQHNPSKIKQTLSNFSSEWIKQLQLAALQCSADEITPILSEIPEEYSELKQYLSYLTNNFSFDIIVELTAGYSH